LTPAAVVQPVTEWRHGLVRSASEAIVGGEDVHESALVAVRSSRG
jgi:hypothetical protein